MLSLMRSRCPRNRSQGRDVVRRALAARLEEKRQPLEVAPVPGRERLEQLEALALGRDLDPNRAAIRRRRRVALVAVHEAVARHVGSRGRWRQPEARAALDLVAERIERETAGQRVGHHDLGARDERARGGVAVVAPAEVAVVGVDDRVLLAGLHVVALPLADAGAAGVRQHDRTDRLEVLPLAIALDRAVDLLGARRHPQRRASADAGGARLACDVGRALQVFVGGVRAAPDQRRGQAIGIAVLGDVGGQPRDRTP
jgi:hypothetical protein